MAWSRARDVDPQGLGTRRAEDQLPFASHFVGELLLATAGGDRHGREGGVRSNGVSVDVTVEVRGQLDMEAICVLAIGQMASATEASAHAMLIYSRNSTTSESSAAATASKKRRTASNSLAGRVEARTCRLVVNTRIPSATEQRAE